MRVSTFASEMSASSFKRVLAVMLAKLPNISDENPGDDLLSDKRINRKIKQINYEYYS